MPITLILSGSFRSGTTALWNELRLNHSPQPVFYEPCHEELFEHVATDGNKPGSNDLHNLSLWDEYRERPSLLAQLATTHPNRGRGNVEPKSRERLLDYVALFDALPEQVILQPNRWNFCLGAIASAFPHIKLIHLIRNPSDTYTSLMGIYFHQGVWAKRVMKNIFRSHFSGRAFWLATHYRNLYRRLGARKHLPTPRQMCTKPHDTFLLVWLLSNVAALDAVKMVGGMTLFYESALADIPALRTRITKYVGLSFCRDTYLRPPPRTRFMNGDEERALTTWAGEYGLTDEVEQVLACAKAC